MGTRRLPVLSALSVLHAFAAPLHRDVALLKRGALAAVRFAYRRLAEPAIAFLVESMDGLFNFIEEFADSADEVSKAMERARWERYTISAHRR